MRWFSPLALLDLSALPMAAYEDLRIYKNDYLHAF